MPHDHHDTAPPHGHSLAEDLPLIQALVARRRALKWFAGAGTAALVAGCGESSLRRNEPGCHRHQPLAAAEECGWTSQIPYHTDHPVARAVEGARCRQVDDGLYQNAGRDPDQGR